jgi:protein-arginine kinase activator protein McsA
MLCQKCGVRQARAIVTSCNGFECYELHLCLKCRNGVSTFPSPDEQQKVVASAMESAKETGLDEESISDALGIDVEEIRRVLRGEGVSHPAVWQVIKKHLRMD